ncbi:alcohol dehydrogenase catalytic domain-containing protein [Pseudactinotalea terrae]|uniref:alcohol dehydrogenase catalytic domain-containing protein n=1 Tax=Pseudactinotalea terrae TaxID=1743262 RepID=UPI0012E2B673|nr:alcohol dehydrogenase catalytic domain-containing protein [Pseudactinotalea terrae]
MKSIVIREPFAVEVADGPTPVLKPGYALLRLTYGGICGSDLAAYRGTSAYVSYPRVIGHELAAEVMEVEDSHGLTSGTPVTMLPYFACGRCVACLRRHPNACRRNETMGVQREGGFSELIAMPAARVYDGGGIDPRALALIEPFSISYHGVAKARVTEDDRVLVIGAGAIGILAAVAARSWGARAWIADVSAVKVERAVSRFGLDGGLVVADPADLRGEVADITDGEGFDVTVEAAGSPAAFLTCVQAAASLGRVVVIGVSTQTAEFNATDLQRKELSVMGSRGATAADFGETLRLVREGFVDLTALISREHSAEMAPAALAELDQDAGTVTKTLLRF